MSKIKSEKTDIADPAYQQFLKMVESKSRVLDIDGSEDSTSAPTPDDIEDEVTEKEEDQDGPIAVPSSAKRVARLPKKENGKTDSRKNAGGSPSASLHISVSEYNQIRAQCLYYSYKTGKRISMRGFVLEMIERGMKSIK